ncbi:MAG TPA: hypothetical protein VMU01_07480 [Rhizomicrobium sp.]|nr:hypothetical protein [Rhizomicrobium sp.]
MRGIIAALAAASIMGCWTGPALAKHRTSHAAQTAQAAQPDSTGTDQSPTIPANADLTGQMIYTSTGNMVGKVAAMTKDGSGARVAVVAAQQRLGIGAIRLLMPVSQLQPRDQGGGYFTNMTQAQVRALPKAP